MQAISTVEARRDRHQFARTVFALAAVAVGLVGVASFAWARPGKPDDAFIVLVYAKHLLQGDGLVWNVGDGPVEGFTSPLDLLLKLGLSAVWSDSALSAAFWASVVLHVSCALAVLLILWRRHDDFGLRAGAVVVAACVASSPALAFGSSFFLETPLFVLAAVACVAASTSETLRYPRARVALCVSCLLLALARPEGIALMLLLIGLVGWRHRAELGKRSCLWLAVAPSVCGALLVARRSYFGYWAPNTYYAKSSGSAVERDQGRHSVRLGRRFDSAW